MGWASGSIIASELIESLSETVDDEYARREFYAKMIEIFEDHDCDTLDECLDIDPAFDKVYNENHVNFTDDWSDEE